MYKNTQSPNVRECFLTKITLPFSKVGHFSDKPLKTGIQYVILVPVEKPSKPRSYRLFRRFPAQNESSVRDLPLVKQN